MGLNDYDTLSLRDLSLWDKTHSQGLGLIAEGWDSSLGVRAYCRGLRLIS